jgi:hypothetical protein
MTAREVLGVGTDTTPLVAHARGLSTTTIQIH